MEVSQFSRPPLSLISPTYYSINSRTRKFHLCKYKFRVRVTYNRDNELENKDVEISNRLDNVLRQLPYLLYCVRFVNVISD